MFFPQLRRGTRQRSKGSQHHRFMYNRVETGRAAGNRKWKTRINSFPQNGNYPLTNRQGDNWRKTMRRISEIQVNFFFLSSSKDEQVWYSLHSSDRHRRPCGCFYILSFPQYQKNQPQSELIQSQFRFMSVNIFWHKLIFCGIIFFSFTFIY